MCGGEFPVAPERGAALYFPHPEPVGGRAAVLHPPAASPSCVVRQAHDEDVSSWPPIGDFLVLRERGAALHFPRPEIVEGRTATLKPPAAPPSKRAAETLAGIRISLKIFAE